ncbi:hypothetical protein EDD16DRAFT_316013 [Pisolithus croceorrhizus]|nr:hypothetical protein EDD16DRAFT_316013 [Pisolithus croceorrhizus]
MYPNVLRHLDLIIDQPKLKDVFGHPMFVEKAVQYTPPAKEKKEKELKQPAPAPALKKEKPKKAEEDDVEDENPNPKIPLISYQIDAQSRGLETHFNKNMRGLGGSLESFYENIVLTSNTTRSRPSSPCLPTRSMGSMELPITRLSLVF